jgi:hypothetical protein
MHDSSTFDNDIRLHIYTELTSRATAPTVGETTNALGLPEADVAAAYDRLAANKAIVLRSGSRDVLMAAPYSAVPTRHVVRIIGQRSYYANCVWDALGVIAMLGADGDVLTSCPDCEVPLELHVRGNAIEPTDSVVHFALPAARWWDNIVFT